MAALSPVATMQDLKVTIRESTLVFPSQETPKTSIFLSNIDQNVNNNVLTTQFFKPNPDFPPENVAKKIKIALENVLVPYDFMAGRLKLNYKTGRLEIDCNAAGAGFVLASSELSLDDIEDYLAHPNLGFRQLVVQRLDNLAPEVDQPLCVFQVTSFKCGGFAIGMSINHILLDGIGIKKFIENLASQAFDHKPLETIPCNDRLLLAARSSPREALALPHPDLLKLDLRGSESPSPTSEELDIRIFKLSSTNIAQLKKKATNEANINARISSFAAAAALIWRCKALSADKVFQKDRISTLLNIIDIRARVKPPLPPEYSGNAVVAIGVSATCEELQNGPFWKAVEMISEGTKEVTDEYVKSLLDWLEVRRGISDAEYMVSSWLRLGYDEVVYPWGKPMYSCPVIYNRKDIGYFFPDAINGGVGVLVSLPAEEMERFEAHFHSFFA